MSHGVYNARLGVRPVYYDPGSYIEEGADSANCVYIDFLSFDSLLISVLTYYRTEEDDSSLPNLDGSYASRNSVLPPGILPHGMPQVKGDLLQFYIYKILLYFN